MALAFSNLPKTARMAVTVLVLAAVSYADYMSGVPASLSLFYLAPVALSAWYVGCAWGCLMAVCSTAMWYFNDWFAGKQLAPPGVFFLDVIMMAGVFVTVALVFDGLHRALSREREMALHDSLTGLFNSRGFFIQVQREIERARRTGSPAALLYIDLDDFKRINDTMGHMEGDRVLKSVADALMESCRRVDLVARLGGDEFAVFLPDTGEDEAKTAAARIFRFLSDKANDGHLRVTASAGLAAYSEPPMSIDQALKDADEAMYNQKASGKNGIGLKAAGTIV